MLFLLAQNGTESLDIIHNAGRDSWVAALFALIVLAGFGLLGWFVRQLWVQQKDMQKFIFTELTQLISKTHDCMNGVKEELHALSSVIANAPCGRDDDQE